MFRVWCASLWPVAEVEQRDKYGFKKGDENFQLDDADDYVDFLPPDKRVEAQAMKCAAAWNMAMDDVLDMAWSKYNEWLLIQKAITLRKPQYTEHDFYMERTSSRYKARKRR
ncbi:MAG: hypothetical protein EHM43_11330 [Ignavibacteriae bacterium]|jgi:hypothetical protein|nr:MAG: hypothetical protein EHM43_11330 [Ignavibacteriota bacterium]